MWYQCREAGRGEDGGCHSLRGLLSSQEQVLESATIVLRADWSEIEVRADQMAKVLKKSSC